MAAAPPTVVALKPATPAVLPTLGGGQTNTRGGGYAQYLAEEPVEDALATNCVLVIGNRGCKTIAAFALPITEDGEGPDGQPIRATPGLPIPEGGRVVIITYDNQTAQALKNRYGSERLKAWGARIIRIMDPRFEPCAKHPEVKFDPCGCERVMVYPGWDGGKSESGPVVVKALDEVCDQLRKSGTVGMLLVDRYDLFILEVAKYAAYNKARVPLDGKLEPGQWVPRANLLNDVDQALRNCVMKDGWVIATGPRDQREGFEKTTFDKKDSQGKMDVRREVVPSKWQEKVMHWWPNVVQVYKERIGVENRYAWRAEVEEGRHPIFRLGASVEITGRHIGAFQDKEAVAFPKDEEGKTFEKAAAKAQAPVVATPAVPTTKPAMTTINLKK